MTKLIAIFLPLLFCTPALAETAAGVSLLGKGLIVTAGGLAGTFLVLILFFLTIKLMQKILK